MVDQAAIEVLVAHMKAVLVMDGSLESIGRSERSWPGRWLACVVRDL